MKTKFFSIFALFFAVVVVFSSCKKEDNEPSKGEFAVVSIDPPSGSAGVSATKKHIIKFNDYVAEASAYGCVVLKDKYGDVVPIEIVWTPNKSIDFMITRGCAWSGMKYTLTINGVKSTSGATVKNFTSTFTLANF